MMQICTTLLDTLQTHRPVTLAHTKQDIHTTTAIHTRAQEKINKLIQTTAHSNNISESSLAKA